MKKHLFTPLILALAFCISLTILPSTAFAADQPISRLGFCQELYAMLTDVKALTPSETVAPFTDTSDPAVNTLFANKLIEGTTDTQFDPKGTLTREQAAVIADRVLTLLEQPQATATDQAFKDQSQIAAWAAASVQRLSQLKIIAGYPNGNFSPQDTLTERQAQRILVRIQSHCYPQLSTNFSFECALDTVTAQTRWIGTQGEKTAAALIRQLWDEYGYTTTYQEFPFTDSQDNLNATQISTTGTNVIAVKPAANENDKADILIFSAHLDSLTGTTGANDNASGVATILELSRLLAPLNSDTELRFIAFSGEEEGLLGSEYYVNQLSADEKARIIGDVQVDMLGHYLSSAVQLYTPDGKETLLTQLLNKQAATPLAIKIASASDHLSFVRGGIPAVMVMQDNLGVENHKSADAVNIINSNLVVPVITLLSQTAQAIMSSDSGSYITEAYRISDLSDRSYTFDDEALNLWGVEKSQVDARLGGGGSFTKQYIDKDTEYDIRVYTYQAKWFDLDTIISTDLRYRYLDGGLSLEDAYLHTEEAGLSEQSLSELLTSRYGAPYIADNGDKIWNSPEYEKSYQFQKQDGKTVLWVFHNWESAGWDIKQYDITEGFDQYRNEPATNWQILQFMEKVLPQDDQWVDTITLWSDGVSYQLGASFPTTDGQNDHYTIRIDAMDVFNADGSYKNLDKTIATMVHEYGHVLTLNSSQCDMSKQTEQQFSAGPETYRADSYIKAFYDRFWKGADSSNYYQHQDWFVDEYAATNPSEDIAESFMLFVLSDKQIGNTIAAQKVNFFYDYPEMVKIRTEIRGNFNYPLDR